MRYLTLIIAVLILIQAPSCNYFKNNGLFGRKARALAEQRAKLDSMRVADSLLKVQRHLVDLENARLDSIRSAEEERVAIAKKNRYNIIVGSFVTPQYAKDLEGVYRQEGYNPEILKMEGTNFELVSAESHQNFYKAIKRLEQFQDTVQIDAWLFIRQ